MSSLLRQTKNTRVLPTGTDQYYRSDFPDNLTDKEIQWLFDNNILTIIDLRSDEEVLKKPCRLKEIEGFRYFHLPVTGGGDTPRSLEHLHIVYRQMIDDQMKMIIDTIMNAESKVLYFCTAGKDRTGVVSALVLKRLGVRDEIIVDDYMKSKDNLMDLLTAYVNMHPEVDIEIIVPHRENMEQLLKQLQIWKVSIMKQYRYLPFEKGCKQRDIARRIWKILDAFAVQVEEVKGNKADIKEGMGGITTAFEESVRGIIMAADAASELVDNLASIQAEMTDNHRIVNEQRQEVNKFR